MWIFTIFSSPAMTERISPNRPGPRGLCPTSYLAFATLSFAPGVPAMSA
jgi:hypothetical protein